MSLFESSNDTRLLTQYVGSYLSAKQASQFNLATVNAAGNAVMRVDNTSSLGFGDKRNSIRISSKSRYTVGSVWIADMVHMPYGVSKAHIRPDA